MRGIVRFQTIALGLAITVTGCASPPSADVDAANAALAKAATDDAGQYAAASLQAAQEAKTALDEELKAQEGKWLKSYDKTKTLAVAKISRLIRFTASGTPRRPARVFLPSPPSRPRAAF